MNEEMNSSFTVPKKCFAMAFMRWLMLIALACATAACATEPKVVDHAFGFDATWDSPDVEVLDYRYGDSRLAGVRNPDWMLEKGKSLQAANTNGPMRVGDALYVKWRIKSSGEVHQTTVDLRSRLPRDITDHRIHFVIKGPQLYVYLISPKRRPPDMAPNGPRRFDYLVVTTIYPDQHKQAVEQYNLVQQDWPAGVLTDLDRETTVHPQLKRDKDKTDRRRVIEFSQSPVVKYMDEGMKVR